MDGDIVSFDLTVNYICPDCAKKDLDGRNGENDDAAQ
jgi:hypothetical protein